MAMRVDQVESVDIREKGVKRAAEGVEVCCGKDPPRGDQFCNQEGKIGTLPSI